MNISNDQKHKLSKHFTHAACKLELNILSIISLLSNMIKAKNRYEKANKGIINKFWNSITDSNPVNDSEFHDELKDKLRQFDQNVRDLEKEYIHEVKQVKFFIKLTVLGDG